MRWRIFLTAASLGLASCGGNDRLAEERVNNADLLNEATVNAILGANIPPEQLAPSNGVDANAAGDDSSAGGGNQAN